MTERPGTIQQTFITFKGMKVFPILSQGKMIMSRKPIEEWILTQRVAWVLDCSGVLETKAINDAGALHDTTDTSRIGSGLCCSLFSLAMGLVP